MSGLEFLQAVKRVNAELPVVMMTAYGTVESAVDAMKAGASDYVLKPFSLAELVLVIRKELATHRLREENRDAARSAGPPLRIQKHRRAQRQNAGRAGAGRARRAHERPPCCSAAKAASAKI